jgi:hypothetical protein
MKFMELFEKSQQSYKIVVSQCTGRALCSHVYGRLSVTGNNVHRPSVINLKIYML